MEGLTSGERILLFAILGLFAAAGLVQMGRGRTQPAYAAPTAIQLTALEQLVETGTNADPAQVERTALSIAANRLAGPEDRARAIALCGCVGLESALPLCRRITTAKEVSPCLRLAALDVIGHMGDETDTAVLQSLATSQDDQVSNAAEQALSILEKRVSGYSTTADRS